MDPLTHRLSPTALATLFLVGAAGGLVGDAAHVQSGTTHYLDTGGVPFVWESPFWFPLLVGTAVTIGGWLRVRVGDAADTTPALAAAAGAAVVGTYAVSALAPDGPALPMTVVIWGLAIVAWATLGGGTKEAAALGAIAAAAGPLVEIALVQSGVFEYAEPIDGLAGVSWWLPGLYFAFGAAGTILGPALARAVDA